MQSRPLPLFTVLSLLGLALESCAPEGTTPPNAQPAPTPIGNLREPSTATATAPAQFKVRLKTTKGDVVLESRREWAPLGVDRFYNLVTLGFFSEIACFRVMPGFVVQFGLHGDPTLTQAWSRVSLGIDQVKEANKRGYVSFAMRGSPDTRTTQLFINLNDNTRLDGMGFAPIARVTEGMEIVDKINAEYGERPVQTRIEAEGNTYLKKDFPKLDYIVSATIEK